MIALIRLESGGNAQAGDVTAWYNVVPDASGDMIIGTTRHTSFGGVDCRTRQAWVRFSNTTLTVREAMRRNGGIGPSETWCNRFHFDLVAILDALPPGQGRRWGQDVFDPTIEISDVKMKEREIDWQQAWPFVVDKRTGLAVPDEQTIIDWHPVTGTEPEDRS